MLNFSRNRWLDRLLASPVLVYPFMHALYHLTWASKALQSTQKLSPVTFLAAFCTVISFEAELTGLRNTHVFIEILKFIQEYVQMSDIH